MNDAKVIIIALIDVCFMCSGVALQKIHGIKAQATGSNPMFSLWAALGGILFIPTFFFPNYVFAYGGKISVFTAVTAVQFIGFGLMGYLFFGEPLTWRMIVGFFAILGGVG